jgi:hypothetical protein
MHGHEECIYYRLNHYEWLETNPDIIRSQGMQSNNGVLNATSVSNATSASTVRLDCFVKSPQHKMTHQPFICLASQATTSSNQGTTTVRKHYCVKAHIEITGIASGRKKCFYYLYCKSLAKDCNGYSKFNCKYYSEFAPNQSELPLTLLGNLSNEFYKAKAKAKQEEKSRRRNEKKSSVQS